MPSGCTAVSDIEREEHDKTFGVKKVRLYASDGTNLVSVVTEDLTSRIYTAGGYTYICEATIGSETSGAVWRVSRVDSSGNELFADSNSNFDNVADDYATLTYG